MGRWRRSANAAARTASAPVVPGPVVPVSVVPVSVAPEGFLADLGLPSSVSDVWVAASGFRMEGTFYAQPQGRDRVRARLAEMFDLGVSVETVIALSEAVAPLGLYGDDLYEVVLDARSLARVQAGQTDSFTAAQASLTGRPERSYTAAVEGDLVDAYVAYLAAGWDPSTGRLLLSRGLDAAGADRVAAQCPDGRNVVPGVWALVAEAVDGDVAAMRAWSRCTGLIGLSSLAIREWHFAAGVRAPLLVGAGVTLAEFYQCPDAFDDDRLALMGALRAGLASV